MAKVATSTHPLLRPYFRARQRSMREDMARSRFDKIGNLFIQSREGKTTDRFRLWIRGYGLSKADTEAGLVGHYVWFQLVEDPDGWRIVTAKDIQPLDKHPERARPKGMFMPNWGHPVLRSAKKNRVFWNEEAAQAHVQQLVDEFPKSVRTKGSTTSVRIFGKHPEHGPIQERILLRVEVQPDGQAVLSYITDPSSRTNKLRDGDAVQGDFTKSVLTRQPGKKKKPPTPGKELVEKMREERKAEMQAEIAAAAPEATSNPVEGGAVARLAAQRAAKAGGPRKPLAPIRPQSEGDA